jgi:hypothetical protein
MRGKFLYLFFVFSLSIFFSCKKDNLKAPLASFLVVKNPTLKTTSSQGSNHHKITDIWYYVDDNFKGVFPIGSIMPVLGTGNSKITLFAGIKNNGISSTRLPYEFYKGHVINQYFESGKTYTFSPVFEYLTNAVFPTEGCEDYEGSGVKYFSVGDSSTEVISDINKVFGGIGYSVFMSMSNSKPTSQIKTSTSMSLPVGGTPIYLELNYKCNQPFEVGVIAGTTEVRPALTVNPSPEWNKIYIQLSQAVSTQPTYNYYDIYIKATKKSDVPTPEIYIDNIKLVTR